MIMTGDKIIGSISRKKLQQLPIPLRWHPTQSWAERDEERSTAPRFVCELWNLESSQIDFLLPRAMIRNCRHDQVIELSG